MLPHQTSQIRGLLKALNPELCAQGVQYSGWFQGFAFNGFWQSEQGFRVYTRLSTTLGCLCIEGMMNGKMLQNR